MRPASWAGATERAHNFSLLALGYSISGFLGPLVAGFTIDHGGFAPRSRSWRCCRSCPIVVLGSRGARACPARIRRMPEAAAGGALELLRIRKLRRVFVINVLLAMGWDLHTIVIPIYGDQIGLSASQIGLILASFGRPRSSCGSRCRWIVRARRPSTRC